MAGEQRTAEMLACDLRRFSDEFPEAVTRLQNRVARHVVELVPKEDRRCPPATLLLFICPFQYQGQQACRLVVLHNPIDWEWVQQSFADNAIKLIRLEPKNAAQPTA